MESIAVWIEQRRRQHGLVRRTCPGLNHIRHLFLPSFLLCVQSVLFLFILACRIIISDLFPRDTKEIYELRPDQLVFICGFRACLSLISLCFFCYCFLLKECFLRYVIGPCVFSLLFFPSSHTLTRLTTSPLLPLLHPSPSIVIRNSSLLFSVAISCTTVKC
jgi:hypothetical protein